MPLNPGAINDMLPWGLDGDEDLGDLVPLADYATATERQRGYQPGLADRQYGNRVWRQTSLVASGLGQYVANRHAAGMVDDGDLDAIEAGLTAAVTATARAALATTAKAGAIRIATTAEVLASTLGTVAVPPSGLTIAAPPGLVAWYAGPTAPAGWLECNGAAVSRTTYAALFAAVGTTYGAGNGTTTFALPDLRGEFVRGWDHGRGADAGRTLGSAQQHAIQDHMHHIPTFSAGAGSGSKINVNDTALTSQDASNQNPDFQTLLTSFTPGADGINVATETRPRSIALMGIIKY